MNEFTKIEWLVGNQVYVLTEEYVHLGNDGLALPPVRRLEESGPLQNGATDRGFRLEPRVIKLVLMLHATDLTEYWAKRRRLNKQFRPREAVSRLRFTFPDGSVRQIDATYDGELTLPSNEKTGFLHTVAVSLKAANPTFYDPAIESLNFQISVSGGSLTVPVSVPLYVGRSTLDQTIQHMYQGDWETSPVINVIGPVTGLKIEQLTTGKKLQFKADYVLNAGEILVIDTQYARSSVTVGGVSVLEQLTDDSDISGFALLPDPDAPDGVNELRVTGTAATAAMNVFIQYNNRYPGI